MLGSQMYNNKHHRIAQKSFQEGLSNVQDYLSNVGKKAKDVFKGFIPKMKFKTKFKMMILQKQELLLRLEIPKLQDLI